MEKIINITAEALKAYYNKLSLLGYENYKNVENLLVLIFLEELLNYDGYQFITAEDYNTIIKALYHLIDCSCNIEYPSYAAVLKQRAIPRIDELNKFRTDENSVLRVKI